MKFSDQVVAAEEKQYEADEAVRAVNARRDHVNSRFNDILCEVGFREWVLAKWSEHVKTTRTNTVAHSPAVKPAEGTDTACAETLSDALREYMVRANLRKTTVPANGVGEFELLRDVLGICDKLPDGALDMMLERLGLQRKGAEVVGFNSVAVGGSTEALVQANQALNRAIAYLGNLDGVGQPFPVRDGVMAARRLCLDAIGYVEGLHKEMTRGK